MSADYSSICVLGKILTLPKKRLIQSANKIDILSFQIGRDHTYGPKNADSSMNRDVYYVDYYGANQNELISVIKTGDTVFVDGEFYSAKLSGGAIILCIRTKIVRLPNVSIKKDVVHIKTVSQDDEQNVRL